jgi:hypothetical protein
MPVKYGWKIWCICLALCCSAWTPYIYLPNTLNMPLPEHKNDLKTVFNAGTDRMFVQASYALDSHVVVLADYTLHHNNINLNNYSYNVGGGYFSKLTPRYRFEILTGFGEGAGNVEMDQYILLGEFRRFSDRYFARSDYSRFYLQGDIAREFPKVELGFGVRISNLFLNGNYKVNRTFRFPFVPSDSTATIENTNFDRSSILLMEPGFSLTAGAHHLRFNFNIGGSFALSPYGIYKTHSDLFEYFYMSLGLAVRLNFNR